MIVAWWDTRNFTNDVRAQRFDASGNRQWTLDGILMTSVITPKSLLDPVPLAPDGSGGAFIAFPIGPFGTSDLRAQHFSSTGARLWGTDGITFCTMDGTQDGVVIAPDDSGGVILAWADGRAAQPGVYAQRMNAAGAPQWAANGIPIYTAGGSVLYLKIVSNGGGRFTAGWLRSRNGMRVLAQSITRLGSVLWTQSGVVVCKGSSSQLTPTIAAGQGGVTFFSWPDGRMGSRYEVYAQALAADSSALWTDNGAPVSTGPGSRVSIGALADQSGGLYLAWEDPRSGSFKDVYAQRVGSDGSLGPPTTSVEPSRKGPTLDFASLAPNPARAGIELRFSLPTAAPVDVSVFDAAGRRVRAIAHEAMTAGEHRLRWDGRDTNGARAPAGLYLVRLTVGSLHAQRKLVKLE